MTELDHTSEEVLRELHHEKLLSLSRIGELCGVHRQTVYYWMNKHEIDRLDRQEQVERAKKRQPAHYATDEYGYEYWRTYLGSGEERARLFVHRLAAVAWFGLDPVKGKVIHHQSRIPWDNREENLSVMSDRQHKSLHAKIRDFGGSNEDV